MCKSLFVRIFLIVMRHYWSKFVLHLVLTMLLHTSLAIVQHSLVLIRSKHRTVIVSHCTCMWLATMHTSTSTRAPFTSRSWSLVSLSSRMRYRLSVMLLRSIRQSCCKVFLLFSFVEGASSMGKLLLSHSSSLLLMNRHSTCYIDIVNMLCLDRLNIHRVVNAVIPLSITCAATATSTSCSIASIVFVVMHSVLCALFPTLFSANVSSRVRELSVHLRLGKLLFRSQITSLIVRLVLPILLMTWAYKSS